MLDQNPCDYDKIFLVNKTIAEISFDRCFSVSRIGHILVFLAIALYVGLTVKRGQNYVSLVGIFTLVSLGTLGRNIFEKERSFHAI